MGREALQCEGVGGVNAKRVAGLALIGALVLTGADLCDVGSSSGGSSGGGGQDGQPKANPCGVITNPDDPSTWCYQVVIPGGKAFLIQGQKAAQKYKEDNPNHIVKRIA
jgi:hypothetical protein